MADAIGFGAIAAQFKTWGIWGIIIAASFFIIVLVGGGIWLVKHNKKKWYLQVKLKMPRNDGRTIIHEEAKGYWDARAATLWVKRFGVFGSKFFVKLDDIRKYLQGEGTIELIGSGVDFKPVLPVSYLEVIDEDTGQKAFILDYKMDFTNDKAWAIEAERRYTKAFSVSDLLEKFQMWIGIGITAAIVIMAEVIKQAIAK